MSDDPTRIDLDTDPRERRFRGRAAHGNVPFDVPFMSQITTNLWVGGCERGLVLPTEIQHLISLYPWEAYTVEHDLQSQLTVRMYDSLDQATEQVEHIATWARLCAEEGPTLVHCQAGLNRSNLIAATVLKQLGATGEAAIRTLREKRSPAVLCNPAFEEWLLSD